MAFDKGRYVYPNLQRCRRAGILTREFSLKDITKKWGLAVNRKGLCRVKLGCVSDYGRCFTFYRNATVVVPFKCREKVVFVRRKEENMA